MTCRDSENALRASSASHDSIGKSSDTRSFAGVLCNGVEGHDIAATQKSSGNEVGIFERNKMSDSDSDLDVRRPSSLERPIGASIKGLVRGHEVKEILDKTRSARADVLQSGEDHGEGAAPVHRIGGRIVTQEEWEDWRRKEDPRYKRQRRRELDAEFERDQKADWKHGIGESAEREARAEEAHRVASEPMGQRFVREEFESELKTRDRWDDPLSRMKSVPLSSEFSTTVKPKSRFQAPPNRFNIPPGYRWDGVVRGTEYEKRWFEKSNEETSKSRRRQVFTGFD